MFDILNRRVGFAHAIGAGLWVAGLALIMLDMAAIWKTAPLGLYVTALAMVLTARGFLMNLHHREVRAFQLGRESVRRIGPR